jgi:hypothetical protein
MHLHCSHVFPHTTIKAINRTYHKSRGAGLERRLYRDTLQSQPTIYLSSLLHVHYVGQFLRDIRVFDNWDNKTVIITEIAVLTGVSSWDTFDHFLILNFECFVVYQSYQYCGRRVSVYTCSSITESISEWVGAELVGGEEERCACGGFQGERRTDVLLGWEGQDKHIFWFQTLQWDQS